MTTTSVNSASAVRLKQIRKMLGMTQAEMAATLKVSLRTLSRLENAERSIPAFALQILVKYGFSADWILIGVGLPQIQRLSLCDVLGMPKIMVAA